MTLKCKINCDLLPKDAQLCLRLRAGREVPQVIEQFPFVGVLDNPLTVAKLAIRNQAGPLTL